MDIWKQLLAFKEKLKSESGNLAWTFDGKVFSSHKSLQNVNTSEILGLLINCGDESDSFTLEARFSKFEMEGYCLYLSNELGYKDIFLLRNYWPIIIRIHANNGNKPFLLIHMAITLDGKICCANGHSKWIGNEQNLIHAHRLRAICDGILVGANTVKMDKPQLNVRLVDGPNPQRLVLSNKTEHFCGLSNNQGRSKTFLLRNKEFCCDIQSDVFDKLIAFKGDTQRDELIDLLQKIKQEGIDSVLIEGGAQTASCFIENDLVNLIQLHLAPIILGSGQSFVNLPEISQIGDGLKLKCPKYIEMGDSVMVTGSLC